MNKRSRGFARLPGQVGHHLLGGPQEQQGGDTMKRNILARTWAFLASQEADHPVWGRLFAVVHRWRYGA